LISIGSTNFGKLINLHLIHQPTNPHNQQVNIFTNVRPENWVIIGTSFIIIISAISKQNWFEVSLTAGLSVLLLLVFNITLKAQQQHLMKKIIKYLRLKEI